MSVTDTPAAGETGSDTRFFGHPRALATLFFTEMWERFSFYGMRAILVFYLTASVSGANPGLGIVEGSANTIYGVYNAMVYLMSMPGGWIADRLVGARRAVLVGGIVIACGHHVMAIPTGSSVFAGMTLIVFGTGLLKPNMSTMVGDLYPLDSPKREFAVTEVGVTFAVIQYVLGGRWLGNAGKQVPNPLEAAERRRILTRTGLLAAAAVVVALILAAAGWLTINVVVNTLTVVTVVMMRLWFLATAVGDAIGGQVARLAGDWQLPTYFLTFGLASVALGLGAFMFTTHIRTLMAGIH